MKIGNTLRKLRYAKKMSQQDIAEYVGVGQSTYFAWENDRTVPNAKYYVRLAAAFGVELKELMNDELAALVDSLPKTESLIVGLQVQNLYDELIESQRQVIYLQQQRLKHLEAENCQLWERIKQSHSAQLS